MALITVWLSIVQETGLAYAATGSWREESLLYATGYAIHDTVAISVDDVWAVGEEGGTPDSEDRSLIIHWNGHRWKNVPAPHVGPGYNQLMAVTAVASNDVWAVGSYGPEAGNPIGSKLLALHWDGTQWNAAPTPVLNGDDVFFQDIAASSSGAVWALVRDGSNGASYAFYWDGSSWSTTLSSPGQPYSYTLNSIHVVNKHNIWITGYRYDNDLRKYISVIFYGDGSSWKEQLLLSQGKFPGNLNNVRFNAIAGSSAANLWVIGQGYTDTNKVRFISLHWDGNSWSTVDIPTPTVQSSGTADDAILQNDGSPIINGGGGPVPTLTALSVASETSAVAVGSSVNASGYLDTLVMEWDGTRWQRATSDNPTGSSNLLYSVTNAPGTERYWAGGYAYILAKSSPRMLVLSRQ